MSVFSYKESSPLLESRRRGLFCCYEIVILCQLPPSIPKPALTLRGFRFIIRYKYKYGRICTFAAAT